MIEEKGSREHPDRRKVKFIYYGLLKSFKSTCEQRSRFRTRKRRADKSFCLDRSTV